MLSGDGQTNDIQRRADSVATSVQLQKSIGNILGGQFHSLGTALLTARQVQKASNSAKHEWTPSTAQDQKFSTSLSSEDDPVSAAERVQQLSRRSASAPDFERDSRGGRIGPIWNEVQQLSCRSVCASDFERDSRG